MRPEFNDPYITLLLLTAVRYPLPDAKLKIAQIVQPAFDWWHFIDLVNRHNVAPVVYWNLKSETAITVPPDVLDWLKTRFSANVQHSVAAGKVLTHLLGLAAAQGIEAIPLKGAVLAQKLYGAPFLREFGDVDILVKVGELKQMYDLVCSQGFEPVQDFEQIAFQTNELDRDYHIQFTHPAHDIELELHWALNVSFIPFEMDIWEHLQTETYNGLQVKTLFDHDLFIYLCVHGAKHRWSYLKWLVDVNAFIVCNGDLDWEALLQRADSLHAKRIVLLGIWLSHIMLETPLSPLLVQHIDRDPVVCRLSEYLKSWIFKQDDNTLSDQFRVMVFFTLLQEQWRYRMPYLRHAMYHKRSRTARNIIIALLLLLGVASMFLVYTLFSFALSLL